MESAVDETEDNDALHAYIGANTWRVFIIRCMDVANCEDQQQNIATSTSWVEELGLR
jgi:hypothetical protein